MRKWDLKAAIGQDVRINASGDLMSDGTLKTIIGKDCKLIKQCKSGLLQVEWRGKFYSLPMKNVDVITAEERLAKLTIEYEALKEDFDTVYAHLRKSLGMTADLRVERRWLRFALQQVQNRCGDEINGLKLSDEPDAVTLDKLIEAVLKGEVK